ncbi:MAG: YdcF family protein [Acidimicrobiales bacterium]|nr:YdcF family protein [Acidimicrobiales bacterium]
MIRRLVKIAGALLALLVLYVAVTFTQVWWASRQDAPRSASAIVVLGAAQWDGRPSPVLAQRLEHAADLYARGLAQLVIVTGGKQAGDRITQGMAGFQYLRGKGVPESALKVEVDGVDTYTELSASALIVGNAGLPPEVILVSDPYHMFRAQAIAREVGLRASPSPTDTSSTFAQLARETAAVAVGRIVSFRRLSNWLN